MRRSHNTRSPSGSASYILLCDIGWIVGRRIPDGDGIAGRRRREVRRCRANCRRVGRVGAWRRRRESAETLRECRQSWWRVRVGTSVFSWRWIFVAANCKTKNIKQKNVKDRYLRSAECSQMKFSMRWGSHFIPINLKTTAKYVFLTNGRLNFYPTL